MKEKDGRNRPCINLKALSKFIQYKHFTMEGLHCLKYLLEENDFLYKIDLKDAYYSVSLCMSSRKFVRFAWLGNLYEFLCLYSACSKDIFKIIKGTNSSTGAAEHSSV